MYGQNHIKFDITWRDQTTLFSYFLVSVDLGIILINNQLDAQFLIYIYLYTYLFIIYIFIYLFWFSTCLEQPCAHHQKSQWYQYIIWYMSLCVRDIYQMMYWYNWLSWWWAQGCSKHV